MSRNASTLTSFSHAFDGLKTAIKREPNFQIHIIIGTIVLVFAAFLKVAKFEWLILLFAIFFVLILELLNTTLEAIVDMVQPKIHPKAKAAKDVAAAGVLMGTIIAVIVGAIIFIPYIINF